jgi:DNA polymerase-3 subunit gamma/tau
LIAATPDQRPALAKAAALFSEEDLTRFFQILLQTDDDLRRKPDPRVHLEMGLLRLINAARLAPLEELLGELKNGAANSGAGRSMALGGAPTPSAKIAAPSFTAAIPSQPKPKAQFSSPFTALASAPPTAITASAEVKQAVAEEEPGIPAKDNGAEALAIGITQEQVAEIKAAVQAQQKFLGELVEQSTLWELEGAELRIYFSPEKRPFAEMMEGRETLEKIRSISSKVLGRAVRVCAKLEAVAAAAASAARGASGTQELRAQFERDPMVRSMLQRFGGKISEVKRSQGES